MKPLKYFTVVSSVNVANFWPVWKFYYQHFLLQPPDEIPLLYTHIPRINTIPYILQENYQILAWHNTCNHFLTNKKHWILLKLWIEYTPHKLLEQGEPEYYSWYQHYRPEKNLQTYPGTVKAQITSTKHYAKYIIIFSIRKKQVNHIIK